VIERGGAPGCDASRAEAVRRWVLPLLRQVWYATSDAPELRQLAGLLNIHVAIDVQTRRGQVRGERFFVHGTTVGRWNSSTVIDPNRGDPGADFGRGFYAYAATPYGVDAARARAGTLSADARRGDGTAPFALVFSMPVTALDSLKKLNYVSQELSKWERDIYDYRGGLRNPFTGFDVVIGRPAAGFDRQSKLFRSVYPDQYAFKSSVAVAGVKFVGILPA
jgi:hypothetical protein